MREIILDITKFIEYENIRPPEKIPIFVKNNNGDLVGMVVRVENCGWCVSTGVVNKSIIYYDNLKACLNAYYADFGYSYFI